MLFDRKLHVLKPNQNRKVLFLMFHVRFRQVGGTEKENKYFLIACLWLKRPK